MRLKSFLTAEETIPRVKALSVSRCHRERGLGHVGASAMSRYSKQLQFPDPEEYTDLQHHQSSYLKAHDSRRYNGLIHQKTMGEESAAQVTQWS